jgi:hypothetical protein
MPRYRLRTLLILMAIGPPLLAGAMTCPHGPIIYLGTLSPLFALAIFFWRRITYKGYI